ncbi:MAG: copper-binding protein [Rhodospirillales bacterium]|nr:copper-binding protein [Rhodospirillales bacterium]
MAVAALLNIGFPKTSFADSLEIEITPDRISACEKAQARYQELYPDADTSGVHVVLLHKYNFCPANLTVKAGETVRWINVDKRTSHSVWLKEAGSDESERFFPEEQWEYTFTMPGDYPYLCGPHWESDSMLGYVKVTQ